MPPYSRAPHAQLIWPVPRSTPESVVTIVLVCMCVSKPECVGLGEDWKVAESVWRTLPLFACVSQARSLVVSGCRIAKWLWSNRESTMAGSIPDQGSLLLKKQLMGSCLHLNCQITFVSPHSCISCFRFAEEPSRRFLGWLSRRGRYLQMGSDDYWTSWHIFVSSYILSRLTIVR